MQGKELQQKRDECWLHVPGRPVYPPLSSSTRTGAHAPRQCIFDFSHRQQKIKSTEKTSILSEIRRSVWNHCVRIDVDASTQQRQRDVDCALSITHTQTASYSLFALVRMFPFVALSRGNIFLSSFSSSISFAAVGFLIAAQSGVERRYSGN